MVVTYFKIAYMSVPPPFILFHIIRLTSCNSNTIFILWKLYLISVKSHLYIKYKKNLNRLHIYLTFIENALLVTWSEHFMCWRFEGHSDIEFVIFWWPRRLKPLVLIIFRLSIIYKNNIINKMLSLIDNNNII